MKFRFWFENTVPAEDVLKMIQSSPNQQARSDWNQFIDRWGVSGNFVRKTVPVSTLVKLVDNYRMYISKYSESDVQNKIKTGQRSPVIITTQGYSQFLYVVIDGTHSLVAAARAGDKTIEVIMPENVEL